MFSLSILSWNIQGLNTRLNPTKNLLSRSKLDIKYVDMLFRKANIVLIQETWLKENCLEFQGIRRTLRII